MKLNYLLSLLFIFLLVSCEISIVTLEKPVQEGTNYDIGQRAWMTIDSIEYRTCVDFPFVNTGAEYYANFILIAFTFTCEADKQPWREVLLRLPYFDGEGEYELGEATNESGWGLISYFVDNSTNDYITTNEYTGKVVITNHTREENTSQILSGTYEFQAKNDSLGVINITNGVFTDIKVTEHF